MEPESAELPQADCWTSYRRRRNTIVTAGDAEESGGASGASEASQGSEVSGGFGGPGGFGGGRVAQLLQLLVSVDMGGAAAVGGADMLTSPDLWPLVCISAPTVFQCRVGNSKTKTKLKVKEWRRNKGGRLLLLPRSDWTKSCLTTPTNRMFGVAAQDTHAHTLGVTFDLVVVQGHFPLSEEAQSIFLEGGRSLRPGEEVEGEGGSQGGEGGGPAGGGAQLDAAGAGGQDPGGGGAAGGDAGSEGGAQPDTSGVGEGGPAGGVALATDGGGAAPLGGGERPEGGRGVALVASGALQAAVVVQVTGAGGAQGVQLRTSHVHLQLLLLLLCRG